MELEGLFTEFVNLQSVSYSGSHLGVTVNRDVSQSQNRPVPLRSIPYQMALSVHIAGDIDDLCRVNSIFTGIVLGSSGTCGLHTSSHHPESAATARTHFIVGITEETAVNRGSRELQTAENDSRLGVNLGVFESLGIKRRV